MAGRLTGNFAQSRVPTTSESMNDMFKTFNKSRQDLIANEIAGEDRLLREKALLQQQANTDRTYGLQEANAKRQAQQDDYNMQIKAAQMGATSDRDIATAAHQTQILKNQAERDRLTAEQRKTVNAMDVDKFQFLKDKYGDEQDQRNDNTKLFQDLGNVRKVTTREEAEGTKGPMASFNRMAEGVTPEESAGMIGGGNLPSLYEAAKLRSAEEVKNPNYDAQIANIISNSTADVATRSTLGKMIKDNKPEPSVQQEFREGIIKKYGIDPTTDEGTKFMDKLRQKAVDKRGYSDTKKSNSSYLLKEMKDVVAFDDPEESNDKLLEMLPDIENYAKTNNISFKDAVEKVKVLTASNRGWFNPIDQDVEEAGETLFGKNY
jgi:hypothetical protein